ncbi:cysteine-rich repeat secretory protein 4-like isoform X2 [Prunus dulcis]|uniref:cysteine-rich repeat secretory protein 4-like isoform X2 n=1 Tax=Prunus dulcis TaxID=3755 RepID=UPI001483AC20|nr:cysteine-rich repeat secretory protein 4-like isoform X2 [Prunus dulcis]
MSVLHDHALTIVFLSFIGLLKLVFCSNSIHYIHHYCSLEVNKTQNAAFQDNVDRLLSDLSSKSYGNRFYNSTSGDNDKKVYGLFLCRGDVSPGVCRDCIDSSTKNLKQNCTHNKESIVWYEECMLRYSNHSIFATEEEMPWRYWCSVNKVSNSDQFNQSLSILMNGLVDKAAFDKTTPPFFATGEDKKGGGGILIYCLMQCTPDINGSECQRCLKAAFSGYQETCEGRTWSMIFSPTCQVRYGSDSFYGEGKPIKSGGGRGKNNSYVAVAAVLCMVLSGLLANLRAW